MVLRFRRRTNIQGQVSRAKLKDLAMAGIAGSMTGSRPVAARAEAGAIVRAAAAEMLPDLGFEVLQAEHAQGCSTAPGSPRSRRAALNMPGPMDGCDRAHTVRTRRPEARIIVWSGCTRAAALLPATAYFIVYPS